MNKNTQLVSIVVVAVIVIVGGYYLFAVPPAPAPVVTEPIATTTAALSAKPAQNNSTTYSNPELGFSFTMPAGWSVKETGGTEGTNQWVYFSNGGTTAVFQVLVSTLVPGDTVFTLRENDEKQGTNSAFATTTIGGEPAYTYTSQAEKDSLTITTLVHGSKEYDLTGPVPASFAFLK